MKVNHVIVANFYVANMSFNAIRENKILAKTFEFTVYSKKGRRKTKPWTLPTQHHRNQNETRDIEGMGLVQSMLT